MASTRTRLVRLAAALVLIGLGLFSYDGLTQIAGAAPPPVVTTDYSAYPPAGSIPANCTGGVGGGGVVQGYRAFLRAAGDPGAGSGQTLRTIQAQIKPGDEVVIRWTNWKIGRASCRE